MNSVSLIGELARDPELGENRAGIPECRMTVVVPRRTREGRRYPGVMYVDVTAFGEEARECAERLRRGSRVGLAGRLSDDPTGRVLIDQLDFLEPLAGTPAKTTDPALKLALVVRPLPGRPCRNAGDGRCRRRAHPPTVRVPGSTGGLGLAPLLRAVCFGSFPLIRSRLPVPDSGILSEFDKDARGPAGWLRQASSSPHP